MLKEETTLHINFTLTYEGVFVPPDLLLSRLAKQVVFVFVFLCVCVTSFGWNYITLAFVLLPDKYAATVNRTYPVPSECEIPRTIPWAAKRQGRTAQQRGIHGSSQGFSKMGTVESTRGFMAQVRVQKNRLMMMAQSELTVNCAFCTEATLRYSNSIFII